MVKCILSGTLLLSNRFVVYLSVTYLSSWSLAIVECLFLAAPWVCLQLMIVVYPDHTHLLFLWSNFLHLKCQQLAQNMHFVLCNVLGVNTLSFSMMSSSGRVIFIYYIT